MNSLYGFLKKFAPPQARVFVGRLIGVPLFLLHFPICLLLLPFRHIKFGLVETERIGHLALNTDLFVRRRWLADVSGNRNRDLIILIAGYPANEQLLRMWQRKLLILYMPFLHIALRSTQQLWAKSYFYEALDMNSNEYEEFNAAPSSLRFTREEEEQGRRKLSEWGIDLGQDWFVCVFARDDSYLSTIYPRADYSYLDHRNADIDTFNLAIEEIVARGGFVLRMGQHVSKPLNIKLDRVIDYASQFRGDFMDIFLAANCRFFLGTPAGISDIATVFDRPQLGVNYVPFGYSPFGKQSLFIPKLIMDAATGQKIPFRRILKNFGSSDCSKDMYGNWMTPHGYRYADNTPEEILAATREMLDRLDGKYNISEEDKNLQQLYFSLFPDGHRSAKIRTPMGIEFLRSHQELLVGD